MKTFYIVVETWQGFTQTLKFDTLTEVSEHLELRAMDGYIVEITHIITVEEK